MLGGARGLLWIVVALLPVTVLLGCSDQTGDEFPPAGSSPPSAGTSATSSAGEGTPQSSETLPPELPALIVDEEEFYLPSKNIACHIDVDRAGCQIYEKNFADPSSPPDCDTDFVAAVVIEDGERVTYGQCQGDPFALPAITLDYGSAAVVGDFACLSERDGVTCWNTRTRHGFVLSRASYQVF